MFSSTAEYALRAIVFLATREQEAGGSRAEGNGGLFSSQSIAKVTKVPPRYLTKVMQDLVEAGLVESQRGRHGGFALARGAEEITVLEVINAVDPIQRITACPLGLPQHGAKLCKLHRKLDDAIATIETMFGSTTIAEMMTPSSRSAACVFPTIRGAAMQSPRRKRRTAHRG
jgi:Rrf2 family transcriptional regulator, nitric oxide-sensitive transcriptional repressor